MFRAFPVIAIVVSWLVGTVQADTLTIAFGQPNYSNMVRDAKLRGDGGLEDWNLGTGSGGSNRFYANYRLDGTLDPTNPRKNTFLQWFDVSSIPVGSTVNSATLTTYLANQSANNRTWVDVKLSRLQSGNNWVEFVLGGNGPHTDGSVTWNNRITHPTTPTPWATPGALDAADIDLGSTQTFDVVGIDGVATTVVRDITPWVQAWVNSPASNAGMLWWGGKNDDSASANRYFHFGTKEDGAGPADESIAAAPSLVIDYTPPGGPVAPIIAEVSPDPDHNAFAGIPYVKQLTLTQGSQPVTWSVNPGFPPGTVVDSVGNVSGWTPGPADVGNTFTISIRATNAQGFDDETWQVVVHAVPPVIAEVTPDPATAVSGVEYVKQLSLTQGSPTVTWSVIQGGTGASVDSTGNVTGWIPGNDEVGQTITFEIQATNAGGSDTEVWQVNVIRGNNGFPTDAVFVVRDPDNGGQTRMYDKHSAPPGTRLTAILPDGNIQQDETDWQSITFSGKGIGNDARLFLARTNLAATDIEIAEIGYLGQTVHSKNLSAIIGGSPGAAISLGNIRYSSVSNTLFVALNPNGNAVSAAVCYEFPLSLADNSRIHTYVGPALPANPARVAVAVNSRDGTLYMTGQHLGDPTAGGLGDVIAFNTAGRAVGGTTSVFAVLIDGQTANAGTPEYFQPSSPIYRKRAGGDDTLIIPTNVSAAPSPVLEFYLNTTLHPVDINGNLAYAGILGGLSVARGWCGQQDIETGDIWLGGFRGGFHAYRALSGATESYEMNPLRNWLDAAVPPFQLCNEPFADADGDSDVDVDDFGSFQRCFTGAIGGASPNCACFDRQQDGDIDNFDFNAFSDCKTGANIPWEPGLTPDCSP